MYPDFTFRFSYDKINQKYFLEEENMKLEMSRESDTSVEEWAQRLQNIIDKKQKGN